MSSIKIKRKSNSKKYFRKSETDAGHGSEDRQGVKRVQAGDGGGRLRGEIQTLHDGHRPPVVQGLFVPHHLQDDGHVRRQHHQVHETVGGVVEADGPGIQEHWKR